MGKTFLFHKDTPEGKVFDLDQVEGLLSKGWVDTPAKLELPKPEETLFTTEQAANARPEELVEMVLGLGYKVLTEEQLKAEIVKNTPEALIGNFSDAELIAEAELRGLKDSADESEIEELESQFNEDPEALIVDELVMLGNTKFKLGLRSSMKEATLIEKIKEAMNA